MNHLTVASHIRISDSSWNLNFVVMFENQVQDEQNGFLLTSIGNQGFSQEFRSANVP